MTQSDIQLKVVVFTSRNKDNKHLDSFKERTKSFVTRKSVAELEKSFVSFVKEGLSGEMSRFYISINDRSNERTLKALQHALIDGNIDASKLTAKVAALASLKENMYDRSSEKWLFDFDPIDGKDLEESLQDFLHDLKEAYYAGHPKQNNQIRLDPIETKSFKTPNGYAVVVDKRFYVNELLRKWTNVECKKDGLLCFDWAIKNDD